MSMSMQPWPSRQFYFQKTGRGGISTRGISGTLFRINLIIYLLLFLVFQSSECHPKPGQNSQWLQFITEYFSGCCLYISRFPVMVSSDFHHMVGMGNGRWQLFYKAKYCLQFILVDGWK